MSQQIAAFGNYTTLSMNIINNEIKRQCSQLKHIDGHCPPITTELNSYVTCWNATPPGTIANQSCPEDDLFDSTKFIYKTCMPDGTWFSNGDSLIGHWTNYTQCINLRELEFHEYINKLFVIGYSISLVALLISLAIFFSFRSLKCTRIRIHSQLFLSFVMNNTMWVIWYKAVIPNSTELSETDPTWCQAVEILLKYFLIANYMWMFCEGLYLHISLVVVFVRDEVAWFWFLLIGWGIPALVILIYALFRIFYYQDTKGCWLASSKAELIYGIPVCITLAVSLVFLINVLRVIMSIMHPKSVSPARTKIKRAARAALILIPLFGLQYILIPFRPRRDEAFADLYEYVTVVITSLQGLAVSCLFCFANQDVHHAISSLIRRKLYASGWSRYPCTAAAGAESAAGVFFLNSGSLNTSSRTL